MKKQIKILVMACFMASVFACQDAENDGGTTHPYTCENGTAKDGESTTENDNKCKACDDGYLLGNEICIARTELLHPPAWVHGEWQATENDTTTTYNFSSDNISVTTSSGGFDVTITYKFVLSFFGDDINIIESYTDTAYTLKMKVKATQEITTILDCQHNDTLTCKVTNLSDGTVSTVVLMRQ